MDIKTVGLDIAKTIFHMVGLNQHGKQVYKRKLKKKSGIELFC